MRIVSGTHKSRRISPPKNLPVRPTTDMAKEALFNILNNEYELSSANVLDLFSGTGNISYEFASRQCDLVTSVEQNSNCIKFIKETKEKLQFDNLEIIQANCFTFIENAWKKYDIIFADPPYDMPDYEKLIKLIFEKKMLSSIGILIVEHSKHTALGKLPQYTKIRNYGGVHFSFFEEVE